MNKIKIDKIIRSRRKTLALVVTPEAALTVRAPLWVSLPQIKSFVFEKRHWILKKQNQVLRRGAAKRKEFSEGEEFFYLGEKYGFRLGEGREVKISDGLYFPAEYLPVARRKMVNWYRERTREIVAARAEFYSRQTGWKYRNISVTSAERRWGSCGPDGSINFSFRLAMAPPEVIDYVVVHELAHIPERNHSARFWAKVGEVLPDYGIRRKWLRENEGFLKI